MIASKTPKPQLDRQKRVNIAHSEIKKRILSLELEPEKKIYEEDLAERLNMSRTPVREALVRLQSERFVDLSPARGALVAPISIKSAIEIYDLLTLLESGAAELLALRGLKANLSRKFAEIMKRMEKETETSNHSAWSEDDSEFHRSIVHACGNEPMARIADIYREHAIRLRNFILPNRPDPNESNFDHRRIVEALEAGDAHTARELMRAHRIYHRRRIVRSLDRKK